MTDYVKLDTHKNYGGPAGLPYQFSYRACKLAPWKLTTWFEITLINCSLKGLPYFEATEPSPHRVPFGKGPLSHRVNDIGHPRYGVKARREKRLSPNIRLVSTNVQHMEPGIIHPSM